MTFSSPAARGQTIMKIRHNIKYIATLKNYKEDRIFSPIRCCMLSKCFNKKRHSKTWKANI